MRYEYLIAAENKQTKQNNPGHPVPKIIKGVNDAESYLAEFKQQERNAEHYNDEVVNCSQKMFESLGLAQIAFPADQELNSRIDAVQAMLTRTSEVLPRESIRERLAWVMTTEDAEEQLSTREKQHMAYIEKTVQPVTDLVDYLKTQINKIVEPHPH